MNHRPVSTSLWAALILLAPLTSLEAQESPWVFSKDLKIRMAYGLQTQDHMRPSSTGLGFNVAYGSPNGKVGLELGYYYKTGDQYIEPVRGDVPDPDKLSPVNLAKSGDSRRNQLDGFAVRLSFQRGITEDWEWQAGVMLGGTRFRHEYVGDVQGQDWNGSNDKSWRETYSGTPGEGGMKVSPYVGLSANVGPFSSFELNLMLVNYSAVNYVHHPGAAASYAYPAGRTVSDPGRLSAHNAFPGDSLEQKNRLIPHLELAYVLRF